MTTAGPLAATQNRELVRADLAAASGAEVRMAIRAGRWSRATHGLARGYLQANLTIVPEQLASDFRRFCELNPKPCPIIDILKVGDPVPRHAAPAADIRIDLPGYRRFADGELVEEPRDLMRLWRRDHVAFLLGCSNSMDEVLLAAGIPQRHLEAEDGRIAVYQSSIRCKPVGGFHGPVAVTMRPIVNNLVECAISISSRYPIAHGAPLHVGDPRSIGIENLQNVQWGRCNELRDGETPVFWACGVTPQAIAVAAKIPEMITHAPGHMFVTDLKLSSVN
jgi:uncharacterized protein YcsI (UPF0317 family)